MTYETELFGLALLFYVYDSCVLLYTNEAVLYPGSRQRWAAATGWVGFVLAGRALLMLNPFTPHHPAFRLHWSFDALPDTADAAVWSDRVPLFNALRPTVLTAGLALYLVLPLGLFTALGAYAIIPALVLLYGSILTGLIKARRGVLRPLDRKRFLGFGFECLACPPFGVNMIRRITLAERIAEPLPLAGARLLDPPAWAHLKEHCLTTLDDVLGDVTHDSDEQRTLIAQRQRLSAL